MNSIDPNWDDSVRYTVYISPDPTFEDILVTECINAVSDTSVEVIHLTDGLTYWWKVLAEDLQGHHVWSLETWSFAFIWEEGDELSAGSRSRHSTGEGGLSEIPKEFSIVSTYPNPFNSRTTVEVALPSTAKLFVSVYDIIGREVSVLADRNYSAGYHSFSFNGTDLPSGIYFIRADVPGKMNQLKKIVLLK
jgi:hypothetical protein